MMGKLRICQDSGCSGPAPFDDLMSGKWYCGTHIALVLLNWAIQQNKLADFNIRYVGKAEEG